MKLTKETPTSIRKAAHKQKMMGKHFRKMEHGVTPLEELVAATPDRQRKLSYLNVSSSTLVSHVRASREQEKK